MFFRFVCACRCCETKPKQIRNETRYVPDHTDDTALSLSLIIIVISHASSSTPCFSVRSFVLCRFVCACRCCETKPKQIRNETRYVPDHTDEAALSLSLIIIVISHPSSSTPCFSVRSFILFIYL